MSTDKTVKYVAKKKPKERLLNGHGKSGVQVHVVAPTVRCPMLASSVNR